MAKFRKKPVVIEAVPVAHVLTAADRQWIGVPPWLRDAFEAGSLIVLQDHLRIRTLEGTMYGEKDDWIIRGVQGELYPCKPDIFAASYEPAE